MELPIKIIVTIIVILVAAFVILAYFSGGIGNVSKLVDSLIASISGNNRPGELATCKSVSGDCKLASECDGNTNILVTGCDSGKVCCIAKPKTA